jgi:hypothetical protein
VLILNLLHVFDDKMKQNKNQILVSPKVSAYLFTYLLTYLLTELFTFLLAYLLSYLLTYSLTYLLSYSLTYFLIYLLTYLSNGFGGLVVSILATGTRVRGFKHGRSRWIFRASEKS